MANASSERVPALLAAARGASSEEARDEALAELGALAARAAEDSDREALVERARRETARVRYLAHAGAVLASTTEVRETLATLARLAVPTLADWAAVDLFTEGPRVERLAVAHVDPAKVALVEELARRYPPDLDDPADGLGQILRTGEAQLVPELPPGLVEAAAKDEEHLRIMRALELRSYVCVPVASRGRVRGALTLIAAESGRRFGPDDLELALEVARRASIALDVADAMDALRATSLRLERADRRKDEFLAMLGHELRNPLAAIATAGEILRVRGGGDAATQRAREAITRQVGHMQRMLDDLLDVARITRGKIRLERSRVDLAEVLRDAAEDFRPALDDAGLALDVRVPAEPLVVDGDRTRLAQIVANLLHNARKFTRRGGHVTARLRGDGDDAVLEVSDDGVGIEPGTADELFEPFVQARRAYDRSGGLGLGLALTRGLAQRHGGSVEARSEGVGRGATFTVRIPRVREGASGGGARPVGRGGALRVLVVEDDLDGGEMMRLLLEALGHRVELATDGPLALALARRLRPELVLCDLGLPNGMDGYAVARALRDSPEAGDPMLVAVTGFGASDHLTRAQEAGFDRFLTKPVDAPVLGDVLEAALRRRA